MNRPMTQTELVAEHDPGQQSLHPGAGELMRPFNVKSSYSREVIATLPRLMELRDEWNALAERFASPLFRHEWFVACAQSFCNPAELHIVVLRSGGKIRAIAPLVYMRQFGLAHLEILGARDLFEPSGILCEDASAHEAMIASLLDYRIPLLLQRFPADRIPPLFDADTARSWVIVEHENTSPWIPITSTWENFEARLKSKIRSGLRRIRRRLEEQGEVVVDIHRGSSVELDRVLAEALRIEASGWKRKNGTAVLSHPRLERFFRTYMRSVSDDGLPVIFLLTVDGKGVAMMLGVEFAERVWMLKVGYDEAWATFAPGVILHHESIRWAFDRGLQGFEFLGSAEPFIESRWMPELHRYRTYRAAPKNMKGMMWLAWEAMRVSRKRLDDYLLRSRHDGK